MFMRYEFAARSDKSKLLRTRRLLKTRYGDGSNCAKPRPTGREQLSLQNVFGRSGDNESALLSGNLWKQQVLEAPLQSSRWNLHSKPSQPDAVESIER